MVGIFAQVSKVGRRLVLPSRSPAVVLNGHTASWEATAEAELRNQSSSAGSLLLGSAASVSFPTSLSSLLLPA